MKKLITILTVLTLTTSLLSGCDYKSAEQTTITVDKYEVCSTLSERGVEVITLRQYYQPSENQPVTLQQAFDHKYDWEVVSPSGNSVASTDANVTADKLTELKMLLTRAAFLHAPYFNNDVFKDSVIRSFGEEVYLECLKTFDK